MIYLALGYLVGKTCTSLISLKLLPPGAAFVFKPMKPITDAQWQKLKTAYLNGEGPLNELAARSGIGATTARRKAAAEDWKAQRDNPPVTPTTVQASPNQVLDVDSVLLELINDLRSAIATAPVRSKESVVSALNPLLALYAARHPVSLHDIIKICTKLEIKPRTFFDALEKNDEELIMASHAAPKQIAGATTE